MKRTLVILFSILIILFIILSILGNRGEYSAERAIYMVNKQFAKIQKDPLATPDAEFQKIIEDYKSFLKKYPDSRLAPFAHILIGRTFMMQRNFDMARSTFERVVQQYDDKPNLAAQAIFEIASTYSEENKVEDVIKSYERVIRDYPLTDQGLQAPFTLAKIEAESVGNVTIHQAYEKARQHYRSLVGKYSNSPIGYKLLFYIGSCHIAEKNWRQAVNVFGEILLTHNDPKYLNAESLEIVLKSINTISIGQLKDYDLPISIYRKFIEQFSNHPAVSIIERMIEGITQMKEKQTQAMPQ